MSRNAHKQELGTQNFHQMSRLERRLASMYKVPSQAFQDQKDSAMILVAGGNQRAPVHPEGMDGGWTGKHFFIGFLFTALPGWSPQLLFFFPTLLTTHSRTSVLGCFYTKKTFLLCPSEGQNNQQQQKNKWNPSQN